jgi:hypothetical protein
MDTYLQGSLCTQPVSGPLSGTDPAVGTCTRQAGFQTGFRPLCWYKPANPAELLPPVSSAPVFRAVAAPAESPAFAVLNGGYFWDSYRDAASR